MDKEKEIMRSAIHLFSEKGYFSTSVKEIADKCGISKGSLYNFFDSKEALLIHIIEHSHKMMLQNAANVNLESSLSPKEQFVKKIVLQYDKFQDNKEFITMLMQALPPQSNPRITWLIQKIRITMLNWYKDGLIMAYGDGIKPYIWDFAVMFQGMIKEYITLAVRENKDIDFERVARFVVEQFEMMISGPTRLDPVLTDNEMADYEAFAIDLEPESPKEQIQQLLEKLLDTINETFLSNEDHQELQATVQYLQAEIAETTPRFFMLKALLAYLQTSKTCAPLARRVETIVKEAFP